MQDFKRNLAGSDPSADGFTVGGRIIFDGTLYGDSSAKTDKLLPPLRVLLRVHAPA